jgi:hypothetical protein
MTQPAPRRGRGRPALFTPELQQALIDAVTGGATQAKAAADLGISTRTVRHHAQHHDDFAQALGAAQDAGHDARHADLPHDAYRYKVLGCRCDDCKAGEARRRARFRAKAKAAKKPPVKRPVRKGADVHHLPQQDRASPPLKAVS